MNTTSQPLFLRENWHRSISRRLYDEICQSLSAIQFKIQELDPNEITMELKQMVNETQKEVKKVNAELLPQILFDFGLEAAIKQLAKNYDPEVELTYLKTSNAPTLSELYLVCCFRTVVELLHVTKNSINGTNRHILISHNSFRISMLYSEAFLKNDFNRSKQSIETDESHILIAQEILKPFGGSLSTQEFSKRAIKILVDIPLC